MAPVISPLAKKLGIKDGMRVLILGAPWGYLNLLAPLPKDVVMTDVIGGAHQLVQFFAISKIEMWGSIPTLLKHAAPGGLVWISYPKKPSAVWSDVSREAAREAMAGTGWRPVTQIAIDEAWSALRFLPRESPRRQLHVGIRRQAAGSAYR